MGYSILWLTIVFVAIVVAASLLYVQRQMNLVTPTLTMIESTHYSISNVYFPAITFCNMNMVSAKRAMALAKNLTRPNHITPDELSQLFRFVLHFQGIGIANQTGYELLHRILQANNLSVGKLITIIRPTCADMIKGCQWKTNTIRCHEIFQPVHTIQGICCSFNSYATAKTALNRLVIYAKLFWIVSCAAPNHIDP